MVEATRTGGPQLPAILPVTLDELAKHTNSLS
jgi:hypothetical protein